MPTYIYRCSSCSSDFERFHKISEQPLEGCPSCGGSVARVPMVGGILTKGAAPACGMGSRCEPSGCGDFGGCPIGGGCPK